MIEKHITITIHTSVGAVIHINLTPEYYGVGDGTGFLIVHHLGEDAVLKIVHGTGFSVVTGADLDDFLEKKGSNLLGAAASYPIVEIIQILKEFEFVENDKI